MEAQFSGDFHRVGRRASISSMIRAEHDCMEQDNVSAMMDYLACCAVCQCSSDLNRLALSVWLTQLSI